MNPLASPCVVIGDLVGSRSVPDRREVHRVLEKALVAVNALVPAMTELRVTAGDEFQGSYRTLGAAIDAALRVRLELLPSLDARFGIGRGEVLILDADRGIEDGPGWWAARAAIEQVEDRAVRAPLRALRTAFQVAQPDQQVEGISPSAVSQRVRADGLGVVLLGHESLVAMP